VADGDHAGIIIAASIRGCLDATSETIIKKFFEKLAEAAVE
jgi:hypothetical protein